MDLRLNDVKLPISLITINSRLYSLAGTRNKGSRKSSKKSNENNFYGKSPNTENKEQIIFERSLASFLALYVQKTQMINSVAWRLI